MLCLNCNKHPASHDPRRGYLPCAHCQNLTTQGIKRQHEWTSDSIKNQRREFRPDMLQPWREGKLSKEYIQHFGTKGIKVTPQEIANATNVWNDYYED